MGYPMYYSMDGATPPVRAGASHAAIAPYGPFETGDGTVVILGVQNEREWQRFCEVVLGQPELTGDPRFESVARRSEHRHALQALIGQVFSGLSGAQVTQRLDAAQIANSRMNTMAEVWRHPQLQARQRWTSVDSPTGVMPALWPPASQSAFEPFMGPIPRVGEHTEAILQELGLSLSAR
jgi:itaconate CoA-transferase